MREYSIVVLLGVGAFAAVLVAIAGFIFFTMAYPRVADAPEITVELTPERLVRGKTLYENVMGCVGCHSKRRLDRYAMPPVAGTEGGGGMRFGPESGLPGTFYAPNITPFALKDWTDGEIYRAITAGLSRDGRSLAPIMPYLIYGRRAADEDIFALIAYMRTLPEVNATHPEPDVGFWDGLGMRMIPTDGTPGERPRESDRALFGQYLVHIAGCADCHTAFANGGYVGTPFAGGRVFRVPGVGIIRSANITPDKKTGIGEWTREQFIDAFISKNRQDYEATVVAPRQPNTVMPWWEFAGLSQLDLSSIYDYLMTLPPTQNEVVTFHVP
jgi:mono/diheme cytochrome c family protein